mgnify:CR=1 FL=1
MTVCDVFGRSSLAVLQQLFFIVGFQDRYPSTNECQPTQNITKSVFSDCLSYKKRGKTLRPCLLFLFYHFFVNLIKNAVWNLKKEL